MFGRATITLGIGPHSSYKYYFDLCWTKLGDKMHTHIDKIPYIIGCGLTFPQPR